MLVLIVVKEHNVHRLLVGQPSLLSLCLTILAAAALCYACIKTGVSLLNAKRWAAFVAMGFGLLLLLFGWECLRYVYLPYAPGMVQGEDLFAFLIAILCIGVGLWWCVYLNLPHVRRHLSNIAVAEPPSAA